MNPEKTAVIAAHWGAPHEEISVTDDGDPEHHLLAGDIVSPATTARLADQIARWIEALPAR